MEQGIESKYLSLPLGEDEETRKQKQKDAAALALAEFNEMMKSSEEGKDGKKKKTKKTDDNNEKKDDNVQTKDGDEKKEDDGDDDNSSNSSTQELPAKQKTCLERWEESLMACSSLAQVFVHLNTLDGSITWSKSVLNARCRLCRRKGDGEKMLLCDACDRGHHMYCLKPPIKQVMYCHAMPSSLVKSRYVFLSSTQMFLYQFIHSFIHCLLIYTFVYCITTFNALFCLPFSSFIHSFIHLFIFHSFIRSFIHLFTLTFTDS